MSSATTRTLLAEVSTLIAERTGLHFPEERWPDLDRRLEAASQELGFEYPAACVLWLRTSSQTQIEALSSHLTIGETYFFREPASFEVLERELLPTLIAQRSERHRSLRLWSAGCCTGEEPYSLAITCARTLPTEQDWNLSVLATDINPKFIAKAKAGVYSEWSFRGAPSWLRQQYFSALPDKQWTVAPEVKKLVRFELLNLAEDGFPSPKNHTQAMDVIFCRNVLMYLTPAHQRRVVQALHRSLADGGCLLVNPAEASTTLFSMFQMEGVGGVILFRKTSQPVRVRDLPRALGPALETESPPPPLSALAFSPALAAFQAPSVLAPLRAEPAAATLSPAPPPPDRLQWARCCADQGRHEEALVACKEAIERDRTDPAAHFLLATIHQELATQEGEGQRFTAGIASARTRGGSLRATSVLGSERNPIVETAEHNQEAIAALCRVLYLEQDHILAHHALAGLYQRLGRMREANRHLAISHALLSAGDKDEVVSESEGLTYGRLAELVRATMGKG